MVDELTLSNREEQILEVARLVRWAIADCMSLNSTSLKEKIDNNQILLFAANALQAVGVKDTDQDPQWLSIQQAKTIATELNIAMESRNVSPCT